MRSCDGAESVGLECNAGQGVELPSWLRVGQAPLMDISGVDSLTTRAKVAVNV